VAAASAADRGSHATYLQGRRRTVCACRFGVRDTRQPVRNRRRAEAGLSRRPPRVLVASHYGPVRSGPSRSAEHPDQRRRSEPPGAVRCIWFFYSSRLLEVYADPGPLIEQDPRPHDGAREDATSIRRSRSLRRWLPRGRSAGAPSPCRAVWRARAMTRRIPPLDSVTTAGPPKSAPPVPGLDTPEESLNSPFLASNQARHDPWPTPMIGTASAARPRWRLPRRSLMKLLFPLGL